MKICVIGTVNHDTIIRRDGNVTRSLGGILYNVVALAGFLGERATVYPVTKIGPEHHPELMSVLGAFPNVDPAGILLTPEGTSENVIDETTGAEKSERLVKKTGPIPFALAAPYLDADLVLVNFVSGFDLTLEDFAALCGRARGTTFVDLHNMFLGLGRHGRRKPRQLRSWPRWVACADIVQANEVEAGMMIGTASPTERDLRSLGEEVVGLGPTSFVVTRGAAGAAVCWRVGSESRFESVPAREGIRVVDTTGCGDVFSAGFAAGYLVSGDPLEACRFANAAAAFNCTLSGLVQARRFRELAPRLGSLSSVRCSRG